MKNFDQLEQNEPKFSAKTTTVATTLPIALSACGGTGGSSQSTGAQNATTAHYQASSPSKSRASLEEASRFLAQATFGTTRSEIESVADTGIEAWIDGQLSITRNISHFDWLESNGWAEESRIFAVWDWRGPLWKDMLTGSDQLRQRVAHAFFDIFAVGIRSLGIAHWRSFAMANFLDVLADNCLGTYRDLLEEVTFSTAIADSLTTLGSKRSQTNGSRPDENYAREIMQLFSIGLFQLNDDGSTMAGGGGFAIPTYSQSDVAELARVFTGMMPVGGHRDRSRNRHRQRLIFDPTYNDNGSINFLGTTVGGGGEVAVGQALDVLVSHTNVGPFIGKRLIQSLVTSNPSPNYIRRVARVFADDGKGERGNLAAVVRAILLDPEARSQPTGSLTAGRLRDPVQRFANWARAFQAYDRSGKWNQIPNVLELGKSPGEAVSIFNFHSPDFSPPLTQIHTLGLLAPEFQIASEQTAISYLNFMFSAILGRLEYFGLEPYLTDFLPFADNVKDLVQELNLVLAAGQMSIGTSQAIEAAVNGITSQGETLAKHRVQLAALLVFSSPEYLVLE